MIDSHTRFNFHSSTGLCRDAAIGMPSPETHLYIMSIYIQTPPFKSDRMAADLDKILGVKVGSAF